MSTYGHPPRAPARTPFVPVLLLALLFGGGYLFLKLVAPTDVHDEAAEPRTVASRGDLSDLEKTTIELFRRTSPSVVHVANLAFVRRSRLTLDVEAIPQGSGSGFIWNEDGYVVTNAHVVAGGNEFWLTLADNSTWKARAVGTAPDNDLAVLLIEGAPPEKLRPLAVGTSSDLQVGQSVLAIGNPFGLDQTLTTGVISGLGREIRAVTGRRISDVIQTDAAINPGNSGGPLLDSAGRLIGVNTSIMSPTGASAGIGFAVPVDAVNRVVPRLIRGERIERAGLGIRMFPDSAVARSGVEGVAVSEVLPDSGAAAAGLRPTQFDRRTGRLVGDIIVAIDDKPIRDREDLLDALVDRGVGEEVRVKVRRGDDEVELTVKLTDLSE